MRHTDTDIDRAAQRFERLADELDPAAVEGENTVDLREVAVATEEVATDQARLREAVALTCTRE